MIDSTEATDLAQPAGAGAVLPPSTLSENRGVMRAAGVIAVGNIASRLMGMVREMVMADLFGASALLSAYKLAALAPMTLYNLIIGGELVTSSLVPVFSDYAAPERRRELWRVFSTFLSLATGVLLVVVALVELFAPQVAALAGAGNFDDPALEQVTIDLLRLMTPAVLFLSAASILSAVLYALQRFTLPAFTVAIFNASIVAVALLRPDEIASLAWGLLLGAVLQVALQLSALRDVRWSWRLDLRHPAVRRILVLYAPIVAGLVINQAVVWISYNLATATDNAAVTYMGYATTLYQFPLGLVVMGLSLATLPTLSQQANGQLIDFRQTLAAGLRLVITLILPAALGLFVLAGPIIDLLFEHGRFLAGDTATTALVLRLYLLGLPFAAVDQMLVFGSYARKDTWRPALVGVVSIIVYLVVALALIGPLGLYSLMLADAVKHLVHTSIMFWLLRRQVGGLAGYGLTVATLKSLAAAVVTGAAAYAVAAGLAFLLAGNHLVAEIAIVGGAGAAGLVAYGLMVRLLDIREVKGLRKVIRHP